MSGWPLAYPCRTCQAKEVVKVLLKDIVPAYGFPWEGIGSDNGAAFMAQVVQEVSRILRIPWKLHSSWRPQSSGMVERMNRSVKVSLTKIMQETSLKWPDALPLALLRVRTSPRGKWKLSPFEIMYGRPYPLSRPILADEARVGDALTVEYISCLAASVSQLHRDLNEIRPEGLTAPLHPFVPGDWVYIKGYKKEPLIPVWKGPFQVLLATQASVKSEGYWIAPYLAPACRPCPHYSLQVYGIAVENITVEYLTIFERLPSSLPQWGPKIVSTLYGELDLYWDQLEIEDAATYKYNPWFPELYSCGFVCTPVEWVNVPEEWKLDTIHRLGSDGREIYTTSIRTDK
ncbi:uncharacterized protein LOC125425495, partial [Sphaerodactylus townsendi]|uniref:uncharacterized protein LOC125425495 n=1 Tax=Sphaerodactylus townsendi TaxID=933632 RepID=UPI002027322A